MGKVNFWTVERVEGLKAMLAAGLDDHQIGAAMGATSQQVKGKRHRLAREAADVAGEPPPRKRPDKTWDARLFESWADRKARLAAERRVSL